MAQQHNRVPVTITRPKWRLALVRAIGPALGWPLAPLRFRVWLFCRLTEWVLNGTRVEIAGRRERFRSAVRAESW